MAPYLAQHRGQLELDLVPGKRAGAFILGAPVGHVIRLLQTEPTLVPKVDLKYVEEDPLAEAIVLSLTVRATNPDSPASTERPPPSDAEACGAHISLLFDPSTQRLKLISIHDLYKTSGPALRLLYRQTECHSNRAVTTGLLVNRLFGPTHPGTFAADTGVFTLAYPGISFEFTIPERHRALFSPASEAKVPHGARQGLANDHNLLEFPDGTTPQCRTIYVYGPGSNWQAAAVPSITQYGAQYRSLSPVSMLTCLQSVHAQPGTGITVLLTDIGTRSDEAHTANRQVEIRLGQTTAQDLIADLGQPATVFYKNDDKMSIHAAEATDSSADVELPCPVVETLGGPLQESPDLGSSSDGQTSQPQERMAARAPVVLKTTDQVPASRDYFYNYYEYGFDVLLDGSNHRCKKVLLHTNVPGHYDFGRYQKCFFALNIASGSDTSPAQAEAICHDSKWDTVRALFDQTPGEPVIFNRGSSEQNPFGPTLFYGHRGLIFEVMQNGYIPTVTLF
ncbi:hypothetical protein H4R34_000274 [Dimargaris verticillata]|uniref:Uncharacterized protein n=1 Tax=Dimargaris verticillata TaxID=2761393 RepID=A0A9W8EBF9_9FUNG|nr:hypothetical protein H4R34_000274 [Dimargaris verticillata]